MQFLDTLKIDEFLSQQDQTGYGRIPTISLYNEPPERELSLDEFEIFSLDRLSLLRGFENCRARGFEKDDLERKMRIVSYFPPIMMSKV